MLNKKKIILPFTLVAFLLSATGQMEAGFWSTVSNFIWKKVDNSDQSKTIARNGLKRKKQSNKPRTEQSRILEALRERKTAKTDKDKKYWDEYVNKSKHLLKHRQYLSINKPKISRVTKRSFAVASGLSALLGYTLYALKNIGTVKAIGISILPLSVWGAFKYANYIVNKPGKTRGYKSFEAFKQEKAKEEKKKADREQRKAQRKNRRRKEKSDEEVEKEFADLEEEVDGLLSNSEEKAN